MLYPFSVLKQARQKKVPWVTLRKIEMLDAQFSPFSPQGEAGHWGLFSPTFSAVSQTMSYGKCTCASSSHCSLYSPEV